MAAASFTFASLRTLYANEQVTPEDIVHMAFDRIATDAREGVWISWRDRDDAIEIARDLRTRDRDELPLYGVPFSVKDNIDVAGLSTTAACPAYRYTPTRSAKVVERLEAAGAICIGKTNLDQFATGLNGTRSPYGVCGSAFDPAMVSGGSSSGSAVSVAMHQVSFSIGTDTGGSGRIPAGLNNVIGLKPTRGTLSSHGLVPCCPSIDCPSVFALDVVDAVEVAKTAFEADYTDPSLRDDIEHAEFGLAAVEHPYNLFTPLPEQQEFFGNSAGRELYVAALEQMASSGAIIKPVDFQPFLDAGRMLFDGPWVAERYAAVGDFLEAHQHEVLETTYGIVTNGTKWTGAQTFLAMHQLSEIRAYVRSLLRSGGFLAVPTVATLYTVEEMKVDPVALNTHHGHYSYFANILDLCAVSVPTGFYPSGMPFGVTLMAPAFRDPAVAGLAKFVSDMSEQPLGRTR